MKIETRTLPVKLTDEEQRLKGAELAGLQKKREGLEDEKATMTSTLGGKIKAVTKDIGEMATVVREKREFREVECEVHSDYGRGVVYVVRPDTGEEVHSRPMRHDERQRELTEVKITVSAPNDPTVEPVTTTLGTIAERAEALKSQDAAKKAVAKKRASRRKATAEAETPPTGDEPEEAKD